APLSPVPPAPAAAGWRSQSLRRALPGAQSTGRARGAVRSALPSRPVQWRPVSADDRPRAGPPEASRSMIATQSWCDQRQGMDTGSGRDYAPDMPRVDSPGPGIPQPLASYTPATRAGDLVFAAGHLASDFRQGVAPEARVDPAFPYYGSAIKKQTRYVLENLKKTFEAAGTSLSYVVKAQVVLTDLAYFNGFDEVWREYFATPPPRTTIGPSGLLVPGCLVEVDLTAAMPSAAPRVVQSSGPRPLANYSEAVVVGDLVFAAGQLARDVKTGGAPGARGGTA